MATERHSILLWGAGQHGCAVAEYARAVGWIVLGFIDDDETKRGGVPGCIGGRGEVAEENQPGVPVNAPGDFSGADGPGAGEDRTQGNDVGRCFVDCRRVDTMLTSERPAEQQKAAERQCPGACDFG